MAATAIARGAGSPAGPAGMDLEDSNVSSPLSEVDDGDANDEEIERLQLTSRRHIGNKSSLSGDDHPGLNGDGSDSDSALSDAASDVNSDVNDTEAETERLYDTPKHQRQRDVVVDQFNNGQVFEHTPSKLRRATRPDRDNGNHEHGSASENESVASGQIGKRDLLGNITARIETSVDEDAKLDSQERKRKRSPVANPTDLEEPLRKRTSSVPAPEVTADEDIPMNEDETTSVNPQSGPQSGGEDDLSSPSNGDVIVEPPERETRATKKSTRSSRRRGLLAGDADSETRDDADLAIEDEIEHPEEDPDAEVDEEVDLAAKNIEEVERKHAAFRDWTQIEDMFSTFRERLYKDRLERLEEEERSLLADEPTHPEYLSMKKCIDDRLHKRVQEIDKEYEFRVRAHERRAVAQRAQIWSQFFQAIREKREQALERLNQQWYEIQSARRNAHSLPDYGLLFPKDPAQRLRNAIAYNTEVSTLAGLAKHEGFPAGPELRGASANELEADFAAIEHVRRGRQRHAAPQSRDDYQPPTFSRLGPAGEQFIKDTPWANPNHSAHKMYQSPTQSEGHVKRTGQPSAVPSSVDSKAGSNGQMAVDRSPAPGSRKSDSPEMARNVLNHATHPMKRVSSIPNLARSSKTAAAS